jgi:hypothetical protein
MVKGSVAPDEDVEKAVSSGVVIFLKCFRGFAFPINFKTMGRVMMA